MITHASIPFAPAGDNPFPNRNEYIGSSDAAVVLGKSPYRSPYTLWLEKRGYGTPVEQSEAMHWGNIHEPLIAAEWSRRAGLAVEPCQEDRVHPMFHFLRAHLDFIVTDESGSFLECKQVTAWQMDDWLSDGPSLAYQIQIAHQMACSGLDRCYLVCLFGGNRLESWTIDRDEELVDMVVDAEVDWWHRYVVNGEEPPVDGSEDCKQSLTVPAGDTSVVIDLTYDAEVKQALEDRDRAAESLSWAEEAKASAENLLRRKLGEHTEAVVGDRKVSWRENKHGVRTLRIGKAKT